MCAAIAIVKMNKKPVNSLSKDFMTEMNITLEKLENDNTCRGVILTSVGHLLFPKSLRPAQKTQAMNVAKTHNGCIFYTLLR